MLNYSFKLAHFRSKILVEQLKMRQAFIIFKSCSTYGTLNSSTTPSMASQTACLKSCGEISSSTAV